MIQARQISKTFGSESQGGGGRIFPVLDSISLTIEDGSFVSIIGPSGCGKSTFLEILAGLQAPTTGDVRIDDTPVMGGLPTAAGDRGSFLKKFRFLSPFSNGLFRDNSRHNVAMIFQDYAIFPWMTVRGNILFTLKLRGVARHERNKTADYYLSLVGLTGSEQKYPSQLSGGMRQKLALARALSVEPRIILMDEPFAAVDALTRERLQEELLQLWQKTKKTIVLVTHDVAEAVYLSDEVVVFSPQPASIRYRVAVDIAYPRRRSSDEVRELTDQLTALLSEG